MLISDSGYIVRMYVVPRSSSSTMQSILDFCFSGADGLCTSIYHVTRECRCCIPRDLALDLQRIITQ